MSVSAEINLDSDSAFVVVKLDLAILKLFSASVNLVASCALFSSVLSSACLTEAFAASTLASA